MLRRLRPLFSALILAGFLYYLYRHRELASVALLFDQGKTVGLSLFLLIFSFLIGGYGWVLILRKLRLDIPTMNILRIWFITQLGKYIPGKVWIPLSRLYLLQTKRKVIVGYSVLLELVLINVTGVCLFLFSCIFWDDGGTVFGQKIIWAALALPLCLIALHPSILGIRLDTMRRWRKQPPLKIAISFKETAELFFYYLFFWIVYGLAFAVLASAFTDLTLKHFIVFAAIYIISIVAGFVSFLTPGGLGVREGVLALLLSQYIDAPTAVYLSLVSRIWVTVVEFIMFLCFSYLGNRAPVQEALSHE